LFGNRRLQATGIGAYDGEDYDFGIKETTDAIVAIGELQLGAEWSRELRRGGRLFANGLWEAQIWGGSGGLTNIINNDIGMTGFSAGVGVIR